MSSTTTVRGFTAATALMRALRLPCNDNEGMSAPSVKRSLAKTTATRAFFAAATAALIWGCTKSMPKRGVEVGPIENQRATT